MNRIRLESSVLAVIDVQGKLAESMCNRDLLFSNLVRVVKGASLLGLPILWTEQVPEKLGPTVEPLRSELEPATPISKSAFSCMGEPRFVESLEELGRRTVILCGIETHVCVYQTALDLLGSGYRVEVLTDAVGSRSESNLHLGLEKMKQAGAGMSGVEMVLFELMRVAEGESFRSLIRIVK